MTNVCTVYCIGTVLLYFYFALSLNIKILFIQNSIFVHFIKIICDNHHWQYQYIFIFIFGLYAFGQKNSMTESSKSVFAIFCCCVFILLAKSSAYIKFTQLPSSLPFALCTHTHAHAHTSNLSISPKVAMNHFGYDSKLFINYNGDLVIR